MAWRGVVCDGDSDFGPAERMAGHRGPPGTRWRRRMMRPEGGSMGRRLERQQKADTPSLRRAGGSVPGGRSEMVRGADGSNRRRRVLQDKEVRNRGALGRIAVPSIQGAACSEEALGRRLDGSVSRRDRRCRSVPESPRAYPPDETVAALIAILITAEALEGGRGRENALFFGVLRVEGGGRRRIRIMKPLCSAFRQIALGIQ